MDYDSNAQQMFSGALIINSKHFQLSQLNNKKKFVKPKKMLLFFGRFDKRHNIRFKQ